MIQRGYGADAPECSSPIGLVRTTRQHETIRCVRTLPHLLCESFSVQIHLSLPHGSRGYEARPDVREKQIQTQVKESKPCVTAKSSTLGETEWTHDQKQSDPHCAFVHCFISMDGSKSHSVEHGMTLDGAVSIQFLFLKLLSSCFYHKYTVQTITQLDSCKKYPSSYLYHKYILYRPQNNWIVTKYQKSIHPVISVVQRRFVSLEDCMVILFKFN